MDKKKNVCTHRNVPVVRCSHRVRQPCQRSPEERGGAEGAWRVRASNHRVAFHNKSTAGNQFSWQETRRCMIHFSVSPELKKEEDFIIFFLFLRKSGDFQVAKVAPAGGSYFCLRQMTIKVDVIWLKLNLSLDKTLQFNKNLHDDTYSTKITKNKP